MATVPAKLTILALLAVWCFKVRVCPAVKAFLDSRAKGKAAYSALKTDGCIGLGGKCGNRLFRRFYYFGDNGIKCSQITCTRCHASYNMRFSLKDAIKMGRLHD